MPEDLRKNVSKMAREGKKITPRSLVPKDKPGHPAMKAAMRNFKEYHGMPGGKKKK